ncbi:MAG: hypothetical protein ACM3U2_09885 [Deltaproteobacteria bacterium]
MKTISRITLAAAFVFGVAIGARAQEDATGTPLEDITHDMKVAASHLSKKTTARPTQLSQEEAVAKLDKLIAELEKERQSMGSGANPNPTRPATASNVRSGPGGMGDLHGTRDQGDRWGELPPHERDRILQSLTEGFPPHYQAILEAYYKRLAVEKRAEDPDAAPPPPPKATPKAAPAKAAPPAKTPAPAKSAAPVKKSAK